MPAGKVEFFDTAKGFGFVVRDDGEDNAFLHVHEWRSSEPPREGQAVRFEDGVRGKPAGRKQRPSCRPTGHDWRR
jgi:cold shock CspA family protein